MVNYVSYPAWIAMVVVAIIIGLGLLLALRGRPLTALLVLAMVGALGLIGVISVPSTHRQFATTLAGNEQYAGPWDAQQARIAEQQAAQATQLATQQRVHASHIAEIVKNQRLAAQMDDAVVQRSPDGSSLETYPDGMQIKQEWGTRRRQIIRPADEHWTLYSSHQNGAVHQTQVRLSFAALLIPLGILFVAFFLLRKRGVGQTGMGSGLSWVSAGAVLLILGGFFVAGRSRTIMTHVPPPLGVEPMPQLPMRLPEAPSPMAVVSGTLPEALEVLQSQVEDRVEEFESLEAIWAHLTAPRIKLVEESDKLAEKSQRDLENAAKLVLKRSLPTADPFTQGWLTNAAKAILKVSVSASDHSAKIVPAELVVDRTTAEAVPSSAAPTGGTPVATVQSAESSPGEGPIAEPLAAGQPAADLAAVAEAPLAASVELGTVESLAPPQTSAAQPAAATSAVIRPDWVDQPPKLVGNTRRMVVHTDPYSTVDECYAKLQEKLRSAVQQRVEQLVLEATGGRWSHAPSPETLGIHMDYILGELCPEEDFVESVQASFGEMKRAHALLEFTPQQDQFLLERWRAFYRTQRVFNVASLASCVFGGLACVYGLLKVDTWTRGYYTKRLFLGVPAAIIGLIAIIAMFA